MRPRLPLLSALLATLTVAAPAAAGPCPNLTLKVDNDIAGSGYSEEKPENWQSNNVGACSGTYRYLSKYVGDLSSKGKAIWKPKITINGFYQVTAGFRATVNRTNDADYFVYDDLGGTTHHVIDQAHVGDCTYEDLGTIYCVAGGQCRVVLDGTDDSKSDCADLTTFKLVNCDEPGDAGVDGGPGRCDGIRQNPAYEVCVETDTTCAGVFTDGAGCVAYCAAAGMTCVARYGGGPMCMKEPPPALPCDAMNGHASDWCECEGLPLDPPDAGDLPDAGPGTGTGGAGTTTSTGGGGGGGGSGGATTTTSGAGGKGGAGGQGGLTTTSSGEGGHGGAVSSGGPESKGGCGCEIAGASSDGSALGRFAVLIAGLLALGARARRRAVSRRAIPG
ncbi:MAG: hypothetical protein ABI193_09025 [Minicystis sp.]